MTETLPIFPGQVRMLWVVLPVALLLLESGSLTPPGALTVAVLTSEPVAAPEMEQTAV